MGGAPAIFASVLVASAACAPGLARSGRAVPAPCDGFTVITYNIHHGAPAGDAYDLRAIAAVIAQEGADIVGLQEVDSRWSARSAHDDQPALLQAWSGKHGCYGPNLATASGGRYGNMILSRYPILECRNQPLPTPAGKEQRGVMEAVVEVDGRRVRVVNTHLGLSREERRAQVDAVAALAGAGNEPRILLGDFNAGPGRDDELAALYRTHADAWDEAGTGPGFTISADAPRARIDFIFLSAALGARCARVPVTRASDHLPVAATVYFR